MIELLKIVFAGLFGLVVFWMFGFLIRTTLKVSNSNNSYMECFINMALGGLMVAVLTAIWRTSGNTILWGAFIPLAFIYFQQRSPKPSPTSKKFINKENVGVFAYAILVVLVSLSYYLILYFKPPFHAIPHFDEGYYAMLGVKNYHFGIETENGVSNMYPNSGNTPYHYPELWLNALLFQILDINPVLGHAVIIKSWLTAIAAIGLRGLTRQLYPGNIQEYFSILTLFLVPVLLDYSNLVQGSSMIHHTKGMVIGIGVIAWLFSYFNGNEKYWIVLLLLPFLNISSAPVVFTSLFLYILFNICVPPPQKILTIAYRFSFVFMSAFFIAIFYFFQKNTVSKAPNFNEFVTSCYSLIIFFQQSYRHFANSVLYLPYLTIPFSLMLFMLGIIGMVRLFFLQMKKHQKLVQLLALIWFIGLIASFVFFPLAGWNAGQLHSMVAGQIMPVLVWLILLWFYKHCKFGFFFQRLNTVLIFGYCFWLFHQTKIYYREFPNSLRCFDYLSEVKSLVGNTASLHFGVTLLNPNEYRGLGKAGARNDLLNSYQVKAFSTSMSPFYMVNLNSLDFSGYELKDFQNLDMDLEENRLKYFWLLYVRKGLVSNSFYRFVKENTDISEISPENEVYLQTKFIQKLKPEFIILSKEAALPIDWLPFIEKSLVDKLSGEQFMKFKPWS